MNAGPLRAAPALVLAAALLLSACGRPTGDFGRARPSTLHDAVLPEIGRRIAEGHRGEPVSRFNLTDDERELGDRAFAFVRPPHLGDWWLETLVEGQRTRILPTVDPGFDPRRYYAFLRAEPFRSSEARWSRVIADIQSDAMLVPPFCAVAARVRRSDAERIAAAERLPSTDEVFLAEAYDRVWENNAVMAWVWRALAYRLTAYRFALDRLQVETPSDKLFEATQVFGALAAARCVGAPAMVRLPAKPARPSRLLGAPDPFDGPVLQK
jgi:hypothetical protein